MYQGESIGREYIPLTATRLRYFGGTSNYWGGTCRPLDADDFNQKSHVDYSGWPIGRGELDPYLEETKSILDIKSARNDTDAVSAEHLQVTACKSRDFKSIEFWRSAPTRFGTKYRSELEHMPNLECYINANVVDINLTENLSNVKQFEIRNYQGKLFKINAKINILAAGGIETPRILLNCNSQFKAGIGNETGLVGRFFATHPRHTVGHFIVEDRIKKSLAENWVSAEKARRYFSPSTFCKQRDEILNFGLRLTPYKPIDNANFKGQIKEIVCDADLAQSAIESVRGEKLDCPDAHGPGDGVIRVSSEQTPNPSSMVGLGSALDKFGMRRIALDWRLSDIDKRTTRLAILRFATFFASTNQGRVQLAEWLPIENDDFDLPGFEVETIAGNHHMCTTRMSDTPRDGVVNSDQKVFGINNLYIAGSSVFSTTGHANPTFTIVQLSLRLANHINGVLKKHG